MDNLLFLNVGSADARIKLVSEDGTSIDTTSNGAIYKEGNNLSFCIQKSRDLPILPFANDTGIVYLNGEFTIAFEGKSILDQLGGFNPSFKVNASNLKEMIETEYSDFIQVEIPESAPAGNVENGIPYPFIFKTRYRELTLKIYRLGSESSISADALNVGTNAVWIDPDTENGAMFCFGDQLTPRPDPLTYLAFGDTELIVDPLPGDKVRMSIDWGGGWLDEVIVDAPGTSITRNVTNAVKTVKVYFDRPIEGITVNGFMVLQNWGTTPYTRARFAGLITSDGYGGRYVPNNLPAYVTDTSSMFADPDGKWNFNDDISMWDVSKVTNMDEMLHGAKQFNRDLSNWCVSNISEEPIDFATGTALTPELKPVWGTCPFNGIKLLSFVKNSKNLRIGAYFDDGVEQTTYIVDSQGSVVSEITGLTTPNIPAGTYSLYCLASEIPNDKTIADLNVTAHNEGLESVTAWSKPTIKGCYISSANYPSTSLIGVPPTRPNSTHTNFEDLFVGAALLNDPNISLWDVSGVTRFNNAFKDCRAFAQDLTAWDVSSGTHFFRMFESTQNFQSPIGNWNMSNATSLESMFQYSRFNQDIGDWDVSKVTNLVNFINEATNFLQDLSSWCVTNIPTQPTNWTWRNSMTPELSPVWGTCPARA